MLTLTKIVFLFICYIIIGACAGATVWFLTTHVNRSAASACRCGCECLGAVEREPGLS